MKGYQMKLQATYKSIKEGTHPDHLIKVGYCSLQYLLTYKSEFAYTYSRVNGWNCDYYEFNVNGKYFVISTGYRPIGRDVNYKIVRYYEKRARELMHRNYEEDGKLVENKRQRLDNLIEEFLYYAEGNYMPMGLEMEIEEASK